MLYVVGINFCNGVWRGSCDILCRFSIYDLWGHNPIHSTILRNMEDRKCRWIFLVCLLNSTYCEYSSNILLVCSKWTLYVVYCFMPACRICRFGHPFEVPLLVQSFMMIVAMLAMVHICTLVKARSILVVQAKRLSGLYFYSTCSDYKSNTFKVFIHEKTLIGKYIYSQSQHSFRYRKCRWGRRD